jgi:hypothetical protein
VPDADHVAPEQRGRAGVIASQLSVPVNTVSTHVRNIYAKLQARDRCSAVHTDERTASAAAAAAAACGRMLVNGNVRTRRASRRIGFVKRRTPGVSLRSPALRPR